MSLPPTPTTPTTPRTPSTPRTPGFNTKSPTIKRILSESRELAAHPDPSLHAAPLESNLFEWHFTLSGPPSSPYANGIYHGRIVLPPSYPLRPPSFRFLTPSGRFETNREICLSISGHHEETWQPAWGIRTALCAIRAFMASEANGQIGGLEMDEKAREKLALESRSWKCAGMCSGDRTNEEVMRECEEEWKVLNEGKDAVREETKVPEELRLAYKDDLERGPPTPTAASGPSTAPVPSTVPPANPQLPPPSIPTIRAGPVANLLARSKPAPSPLRATTSSSDVSAGAVRQRPAPMTGLNPMMGAPTPATAAYGRMPHTAAYAQTPMTGRPLMTPKVKVVPPTPTTPGSTVGLGRGGGGLQEAIPGWVDKLIVGLIVGLVVMVIRKFMSGEDF